MRVTVKLFWLLAIGLVAFAKPQARHLWLVGDSTMANKAPHAAPETGWGMALNQLLRKDVVLHNHAANGRSSKSFVGEGRWQAVLDSLGPGHYVVIQFGHNDAKPDTARHTDALGSYKHYLHQYVAQARARGAVPVLCSSVVRRHFDAQGRLIDTHGPYLMAVRAVAAEAGCAFVDLEASSRQLVGKLGPEQSKALYVFCRPAQFVHRPSGTQDSTHFSERGAQAVARLFVADVKKQGLGLARWLR